MHWNATGGFRKPGFSSYNTHLHLAWNGSSPDFQNAPEGYYGVLAYICKIILRILSELVLQELTCTLHLLLLLLLLPHDGSDITETARSHEGSHCSCRVPQRICIYAK